MSLKVTNSFPLFLCRTTSERQRHPTATVAFSLPRQNISILPAANRKKVVIVRFSFGSIITTSEKNKYSPQRRIRGKGSTAARPIKTPNVTAMAFPPQKLLKSGKAWPIAGAAIISGNKTASYPQTRMADSTGTIPFDSSKIRHRIPIPIPAYLKVLAVPGLWSSLSAATSIPRIFLGNHLQKSMLPER